MYRNGSLQCGLWQLHHGLCTGFLVGIHVLVTHMSLYMPAIPKGSMPHRPTCAEMTYLMSLIFFLITHVEFKKCSRRTVDFKILPPIFVADGDSGRWPQQGLYRGTGARSGLSDVPAGNRV